MTEQLGPPFVKAAYVYAVIVILVVGLAFASNVFSQPQTAPITGQTSTSTTTSTPSPESSVVAVGVTGNGATATFNPAVIRVEMGVNNTVAWSNSDIVIHTVTSTNQTASGGLLFNSGDIGRGAEFSYTFTSPGTYTYICVYHAEMAGKVIVIA